MCSIRTGIDKKEKKEGDRILVMPWFLCFKKERTFKLYDNTYQPILKMVFDFVFIFMKMCGRR